MSPLLPRLNISSLLPISLLSDLSSRQLLIGKVESAHSNFSLTVLPSHNFPLHWCGLSTVHSEHLFGHHGALLSLVTLVFVALPVSHFLPLAPGCQQCFVLPFPNVSQLESAGTSCVQHGAAQ